MSDSQNAFGRSLRALRRKYGLSQGMLSYFLEGSPSDGQISRYERGENLPDHTGDVERIADAIVCTDDERLTLLKAYNRSWACRKGTIALLPL